MTITTTNRRPVLHFAPAANWMNDPNGLVYFEGEYHLFFQYHPDGTTWGPMHWGHAVSTDLVHWNELPVALYPDQHGTIFSGSCVVDWHNTSGFFPDEPGLVAIFTHHLDRHDGSPPVQTQSLAYSHDRGRTWTKYDGNPVLTGTEPDFRDPKVFWHTPSGRWIMSLATGQTITFFSSPDLRHWSKESVFGHSNGAHDGVWECPDLFELPLEGTDETRWVLLVSIGDNPEGEAGSRTQYFTGHFDGAVFTPEHTDIRWLDHGRDNYAGVSFSDLPAEDGRRIYLGWMSNWRYANQVPTETWRSQMTLPRELTLHRIHGQSELHQRVVAEVTDVLKKQGTPARYESFDLSHATGQPAVITVHHNRTQHTRFTLDPAAGTLTIDRSRSGITGFSPSFATVQTIPLPKGSPIERAELFTDTYSIELFLNAGQLAITTLVFPDEGDTSVEIERKA